MELKKLLPFLLVTGLVIAGIYSSKNSFLLKTPKAQHGMLSLGFCFDNKKQAAILKEWRADTAFEQAYSKKSDSVYTAVPVVGLPTAIAQREADFVFIFFYVCLFGLLIYTNSGDYTGSPGLRTALLVLLAAGIFDGLQNLFMLHDMRMIAQGSGHTEMAPFVFITFCLKWVFWIFTLSFFYQRVIREHQADFLKNVNTLGGELAAQLWRFRIVVIGLLILYLVLTFVDQGEDLLVAIGDTVASAGCFVVVIFVLALLNWYLPKIYDNTRNLKKPKNKKSGYDEDGSNIKKYLGRITGSVTLLVPATGILSVMQTYHVPYLIQAVPAWLIFLLVVWLYIELLRHKLLDKVYKAGDDFIEKRYWWTFALILAVIAGLACCISALISPLACLSIIFFLLSFLFLLTVNYRVEFKKDIPFLKILYIASVIVFLLFFLFNFHFISSALTEKNRFFSLPVFIAGVVFYTVLASGLLLLGRRVKFQFITTLLVLGIILSSHSITDFHQVSTVPRTIKPDVKEESLRAYIHRWLKTRHDEIQSQSDKGRDYPVFFVNAYGGGIRAAAWTVMAVGQLNYLMQHDTTSSLFSRDFEHYVFSYSGASGGTIGESLLAGARIHDAAHPLTDYGFHDTSRLVKVFQHDYLTDDLVGILGRDAWMGSFGFSWYADRAALTEQGYECYTKALGISYDIPFRVGWHDLKMEVPLLVSNTFDVNTSRKGILSPVTLSPSDFPGVVLVQSLIDSSRDIHLSSGAFLSARFPYVSPTGKFDENHHFTDGGSIENAGSETSLQLIRVFNSVLDSLKQQDSVYKKIKICILSLPNSVPAIVKAERKKNVYELTAPPMGLIGTIDGNADRDEAINQDSARRFCWHYFSMAPQDAKIEDGKIHPLLPLGWQISDYALEMMEATVARKKNSDLIKIMDLFETQFKK